MAFDPSTRSARPAVWPELVSTADSVVSPDEKWVAFEVKADGGRQIWLRRAGSDRAEQLAGGNCVNTSPAWELDSKAIFFTSDCQRGIGLPALYRAGVVGQ
jgi:Tol biopolymer transport system component